MRTDTQRLLLFMGLSFLTMLGMQYLLVQFGWVRPPAEPGPEPAPPAVVKAPAAPPAGPPAPVAAQAEEVKPAAPQAPAIKLWPARDLVLGDDSYRLKVQVDQKGAGVAWLASTKFLAERVEGEKLKRPLQLIQPDPTAPPSFAINLVPVDHGPAAREALRLDNRVWEVVVDEAGRAVRPILKDGKTVGQELSLRTTAGEPAVTLTRTYRLAPDHDGFEMVLRFEGDQARSVSYELAGPHGVPIEGAWYTGTFRDVFVSQADEDKPKTHTAYDVVWYHDRPAELHNVRYEGQPLAFAGIENQYFAVFLATDPASRTPERRWDKSTLPVVVHPNAEDQQKADVSVVVTSRPVPVGPNVATTHTYQVFAGPKKADILANFGAEELAAFRKGWQIPILGPLGSLVAKYVITPLLTRIHGVTAFFAGLFGKGGNYGFAIILLVITVRLVLFPLSRKQAIMAKRMQELQPHLVALKEKCGDDKEKYTREMFALQRKHGVNMFGGCLPALIQVPIFIGLWQALNNSVDLRQAPFILWIKDLSAPDMLFRFPFDMQSVPWIGHLIGPYFNVLPLVSAALMLVHTKLFTPPPTTEEAKMQQQMMKYMMVFMAFMLYRVPSGLGIYFITSSTWAIAERLLLPKTVKSKAVSLDDESGGDKGGHGGGPGGNGAPGGKGGWLAQKLEKLLEEASKDPTVRNALKERQERPSDAMSKEKEKDNADRDRPPNRPRPRSRPGKRR